MDELASFLSKELSIDKSTLQKAISSFNQHVPVKELSQPATTYQTRPELQAPHLIASHEQILQSIKKTESSTSLLSQLLDTTKLTLKFLAESVFEVTPKTLAKYKNELTPLPMRICEISYKLLGLYTLGVDVFGTVDSFNQWCVKPAIGLDFNVPRDYFSTVSGIDYIAEELQRIAFGYPV